MPKNLCAKVPEGVGFDQAAFTVLGAIAMQGVRLSKVTLGETVLVIGLGLVGQMTVALLKAAGATVIGTDLDPAKCELAKQMGVKRFIFALFEVKQEVRGWQKKAPLTLI